MRQLGKVFIAFIFMSLTGPFRLGFSFVSMLVMVMYDDPDENRKDEWITLE